MVTFVTLFVSLVAGAQSVEVAVTGPVAAVELRLDGERVGLIEGEPWTIECDFGPTLTPHELVAIAHDHDGQEIGRARQLVNVPRAQAEASFMIDRDELGFPRRARLVYGSVGNARPTAVRVTFDGQPLPATDLERIDLPEYDPEQTHLLSAQLEFPDEVDSRADAFFGGHYGGEARTELTAVPVELDEDAAPPSLEALAGWFEVGGKPVAVAGIEQAGTLAIAVRDRPSKPKLLRIGIKQERLSRRRFRPDEVLVAQELGADRDRLRFVVPVPSRVTGYELRVDLFAVSGTYALSRGRLAWLLTHLMSPDASGQRLADAIAVAAVRAAAGSCPRAVVLIVDGNPEDSSRQSPDVVRRYLKALRVPLVVWSTNPDVRSLPEWGEVRDVSTRKKLQKTCTELEDGLERQWIVWLEGQHLPQAVTLSDKVEGLRLVE